MLRVLHYFPLLLVLVACASGQDMSYSSPFFRVQMAAGQPGFTNFAVDSLGKAKLDLNVMLPLGAPPSQYAATRVGARVEYRTAGGQGPAVWAFDFSEQRISIRSVYSATFPPQPLVLGFDPVRCHATLLGLFNDDGAIALPALLHFPDRGTFRITSPTKGLALGYDALRDSDNFVRVTFPPATAASPTVEYDLEITAIYPHDPRIDKDPRYDGYRRDFLNIFQINPRYKVLANHAASDPVAFTVFMYSKMAIQMPPLAEGLSALDILRQTLDRYTGGMKGYGMAGYGDIKALKYDFLDVYPSLVLAAADYESASHDRVWLLRNYATVKAWADKMIQFDTDGDGLMEYPLSGNSGSWTAKVTIRPANWWDTIGFGHKDAYSNALAYGAFQAISRLSRRAGHPEDARLFEARAKKLKAVYYATFYNPATGVLAGWKSADGRLHDYYFLFVNGAAVTYGLVSPEQGNAIWDKLLAKMKEVGYARFDLGLPGNLIPIRREDYVHLEKRFGGPDREDGSDGFQIYENGGATACYAYFTIQALRELGRDQAADAILYPMLKAFEDGGFQGRGPNGQTYDWKDWNGGPHGYEGLLVDGYLTLLAATPRAGTH
ncbi:MAG: hypothetical protein WBW33_23545 [Bryobacteraceae bacterium]